MLPCDDSVVRVVRDQEVARGTADPPVPRIRAAAGWTRRRWPAGAGGRRRAEEHFCLTDVHAHTCPGTIGDMETLETLRAFERAGGPTQRNPAPAICDWPPTCIRVSHPQLAERRAGDRPLDLVQHHQCARGVAAGRARAHCEPVIGFRSTAPATAAIKRSGAARFSSSGTTVTASSGSGHLLPVPLPGGECGRAQSVAGGAVSVVDGRYRLDAGFAPGHRGPSKLNCKLTRFTIGE